MADKAKRELARRAVACRHWRWLPGMKVLVGSSYGTAGGRFVDGSAVESGGLPDLDDPATLGCLLALVREAWGAWFVRCEREAYGIEVSVQHRPQSMTTFLGGGMAAALVAALEAAPEID